MLLPLPMLALILTGGSGTSMNGFGSFYQNRTALRRSPFATDSLATRSADPPLAGESETAYASAGPVTIYAFASGGSTIGFGSAIGSAG